MVGAGHGVLAKECNLHCTGGGSIIKGLSSAACSVLSGAWGQRQLTECVLLMHSTRLDKLKLESGQVKGNVDFTAEAD